MVADFDRDLRREPSVGLVVAADVSRSNRRRSATAAAPVGSRSQRRSAMAAEPVGGSSTAVTAVRSLSRG